MGTLITNGHIRPREFSETVAFFPLKYDGTAKVLLWIVNDKTNKMTVRLANTQISLGIRAVWSESSLCAKVMWPGRGVNSSQTRCWLRQRVLCEFRMRQPWKHVDIRKAKYQTAHPASHRANFQLFFVYREPVRHRHRHQTTEVIHRINSVEYIRKKEISLLHKRH